MESSRRAPRVPTLEVTLVDPTDKYGLQISVSDDDNGNQNVVELWQCEQINQNLKKFENSL